MSETSALYRQGGIVDVVQANRAMSLFWNAVLRINCFLC